MDSFLNWFFSFITTMFSGIWNGIVSFFKGIIKIFDFGTYFGLFSNYGSQMGPVGWILAVLCFILVYVFWFGVGFLIFLGIRRIVRFRTTVSQNDDLLDEIAALHKDMDRVIKEKEKILEMKVQPGFSPEDYIAEAEQQVRDEEEAENKPAEVHERRFFRLSSIDDKYVSYVDPGYENTMNLKELCDDFRNFACSHSHLYYEIKTIRLMFAGLSTTKLVVLQGISGTGKTSLPYCMGKYFESETTVASVQPSWKDRSELFGFFNEFTKKFNETEVLCRIYEASFNQNVNIIVLDEMNIARVEYYFAEMLSVLELPDHDSWKLQLVSSVWENDPVHLETGNLKIPENVWYVGTANNDDSTYSISDKVYDRAFVINLDSKGIPFDAPQTSSKRVSYDYVAQMYDEAVAQNPVRDEIIKKIEELDLYVIEHFRVAFGNRIMKQLRTFVPVYMACGGGEIEAVDYMLCTKVFRKFEALNLVLIRDEIKGLIATLDRLFGKDMMKDSIAFLIRLQKSY